MDSQDAIIVQVSHNSMYIYMIIRVYIYIQDRPFRGGDVSDHNGNIDKLLI